MRLNGHDLRLFYEENCNPGDTFPPPTLCYIFNRYSTIIFTGKYESESPSPLDIRQYFYLLEEDYDMRKHYLIFFSPVGISL